MAHQPDVPGARRSLVGQGQRPDVVEAHHDHIGGPRCHDAHGLFDVRRIG